MTLMQQDRRIAEATLTLHVWQGANDRSLTLTSPSDPKFIMTLSPGTSMYEQVRRLLERQHISMS